MPIVIASTVFIFVCNYCLYIEFLGWTSYLSKVGPIKNNSLFRKEVENILV